MNLIFYEDIAGYCHRNIFVISVVLLAFIHCKIWDPSHCERRESVNAVSNNMRYTEIALRKLSVEKRKVVQMQHAYSHTRDECSMTAYKLRASFSSRHICRGDLSRELVASAVAMMMMTYSVRVVNSEAGASVLGTSNKLGEWVSEWVTDWVRDFCLWVSSAVKGATETKFDTKVA